MGSPHIFGEKYTKARIVKYKCQLGTDRAIITTFRPKVEMQTAARLKKLEQKLSSKMHVMDKKLT